MLLFIVHEADLEDAAALCDGIGEIQTAAEALGNAPVAAQGVIAKQADLRMGTALLLLCLHRRAVMGIDIKVVAVAARIFISNTSRTAKPNSTFFYYAEELANERQYKEHCADLV